MTALEVSEATNRSAPGPPGKPEAVAAAPDESPGDRAALIAFYASTDRAVRPPRTDSARRE